MRASYADSIIVRLERENIFLNSALLKKDSIRLLVVVKCKVIDSLNVNQEKLISEQAFLLESKDKDLRKTKRQKTVLGTVLTVVAILAMF